MGKKGTKKKNTNNTSKQTNNNNNKNNNNKVKTDTNNNNTTTSNNNNGGVDDDHNNLSNDQQQQQQDLIASSTVVVDEGTTTKAIISETTEKQEGSTDVIKKDEGAVHNDQQKSKAILLTNDPVIKQEPVVVEEGKRYKCPFCTNDDVVECKMEYKTMIGTLSCRLCGASYQMPIHSLSEPIDIFSKWLNDCEHAQHNSQGDVVVEEKIQKVVEEVIEQQKETEENTATSTAVTNETSACGNDGTPATTTKIQDENTNNNNNNENDTNNNNTNHQELHVKIYNDILMEDYINQIDDNKKKLIGSIDQGTSSTRFVLYSPYKARIIAYSQMEHEQIYPNIGWHEHNPIELWNNIVKCMNGLYEQMTIQYDIILNNTNVSVIGITNQRETTVAWNAYTGIPYYNAIVWDCCRTSYIANELSMSHHLKNNRFRNNTGLPLSSYFAATKVKWLLDHVPTLSYDLIHHTNSICFGTIDTWILYQLTGGYNQTTNTYCFKTDVSNASRWLFYNLHTKIWDQNIIHTICSPHTVPANIVLPQICPSSYIYGYCQSVTLTNSAANILPLSFHNIPIGSVLGDQQAALFGQAAFNPGQAKNTYGTGLFLMMNTGTEIVPSQHGLLTTVAYQIGEDGPIHYALEGSVSFSGSTIQWLRDQLGIIKDASESEILALTTESNDGLYFVPAFNGLLAPYWKSDARGCIVGMSSSHHKGHICRAALEATAYQTKSVFDAITKDCNGISLQQLYVDGGGTNNQLLMQFQADIIRVPVIKPKVMETTSMGAAFAAGLAIGIYNNIDDIKTLIGVDQMFIPHMSESLYQTNWHGWTKAIERSFHWIDENSQVDKIIISNNDNNHMQDDDDNVDNDKNIHLSESIDEEHDMVVLKNNDDHDVNNIHDDVTVVLANLPSKTKSSSTQTFPSGKDVVPPTTKQQSTSTTTSAVTTNAFVGEVYDLDESTLFKEGVTYDILPSDIEVIQQQLTSKDVTENKKIDDDNGYPSNSFQTVTMLLTATAAMSIGFILGAMKKR